jgi:hypothetical protein
VIVEEDEQWESVKKYATLKIFPYQNKEWILGLPFLNDFYQVYDMKRNQIGLVPSKYTNNNPELLLQIPPESKDETPRFWIIVMSCFGVFLITFLLRNSVI